MELSILAFCAILLLYHHAGYPVLLRFLAKQLGRNSSIQAGASAPLSEIPSVGMLIPAHNEERVMRQKMLNCAELDYPREKLAVVVALDGCTDGTQRILRDALAEWPLQSVRSVVIEPNIGKVGVLNRLVPEIHADLVALSDASSVLQSDAIRRAAAHFADPHVGVVCGTYVMPKDSSPGERAYWEYQTRIKSNEAVVAAPMGAHGAFYIFRRALWTPLEPDTINDDFVLPMRIVAAGWKGIYDREIVAVELEATGSRQDFRRRVRIGAGNLQQALRLWRLANPTNPRLAFVFVSGKGLRAFMPFIFLAAFAASVLLALSGSAVGEFLLVAELAAGVLVLASAVMPGLLPRPLNSLVYLIQGYVASGLGALLLLSGQARAAWQVSKTGRTSVSSTSADIDP